MVFGTGLHTPGSRGARPQYWPRAHEHPRPRAHQTADTTSAFEVEMAGACLVRKDSPSVLRRIHPHWRQRVHTVSLCACVSTQTSPHQPCCGGGAAVVDSAIHAAGRARQVGPPEADESVGLGLGEKVVKDPDGRLPVHTRGVELRHPHILGLLLPLAIWDEVRSDGGGGVEEEEGEQLASTQWTERTHTTSRAGPARGRPACGEGRLRRPQSRRPFASVCSRHRPERPRET